MKKITLTSLLLLLSTTIFAQIAVYKGTETKTILCNVEGNFIRRGVSLNFDNIICRIDDSFIYEGYSKDKILFTLIDGYFYKGYSYSDLSDVVINIQGNTIYDGYSKNYIGTISRSEENTIIKKTKLFSSMPTAIFLIIKSVLFGYYYPAIP